MARLLSLVGLACLLVALAGCGGSGAPAKVKVTGQLLRNQQPLKLSTSAMKTMIFTPYDKGTQYNTYAAMVEDDGSFTVDDVPPGKYRITLQLLDAPGDLCKGLFSEENSKLVRDVTGKETLKIDITKPAGE